MSPKASDQSPSTQEKTVSTTGTIGQAQLNALITANLRLAKEIERGYRTWWESAQRAHDADKELGSKLLQCSDPTQAVALYNEWVMNQAARFMEDAKGFSKVWLDFCTSIAQEAATSSAASSIAPEDGASKK
jgi:hypothetical protein